MRIIALALILIPLANCNKTALSVCNDHQSLYQEADFPIGVAIDTDRLGGNPVYKTIAAKQFNSFTAEDIFKAEYLHPSENVFNWTAADLLVEFCIHNDKRIHGHTLIWHMQLPGWLMNYNGNAVAWENLFKNHIQSIVEHFKGKVSAWDVVNEAFNEDGTLRNSIWLQKIGNSYIEKAFRYVQEADPDALLFYNDYNLESNPVKRKSVINYLNALRDRGIRIDGIGLQMHVNISYPEPSQIAAALKDVADNHYKVHISELDISVNPSGESIQEITSLFEKQADHLGKIVTSYQQIPSLYQYGITFWGIGDKDSWIPSYYAREDYPLLYDSNYSPKPAYCTLIGIL